MCYDMASIKPRIFHTASLLDFRCEFWCILLNKIGLQNIPANMHTSSDIVIRIPQNKVQRMVQTMYHMLQLRH